MPRAIRKSDYWGNVTHFGRTIFLARSALTTRLRGEEISVAGERTNISPLSDGIFPAIAHAARSRGQTFQPTGGLRCSIDRRRF
jgi:hypothetical protein